MTKSKSDEEILVIGRGSYPKSVTQVGYDELGSISHLGEYDSVILDLNIEENEMRHLMESYEISKENIHKLLWSQGQLFILMPTFKEFELDRESFRVLDFLPLDRVGWKWEEGEKIIVHDENFEDYHQSVRKWWFYLHDSPKIGSKTLQSFLSDKESRKMGSTQTKSSRIASNNFKKAVSFQIRYGYSERYGSRNYYSGPISFLQPPNNSNEAIQSILSYLGVHIESKEPTWTNDYKVPEEEEVLDKISKAEEEIAELESKIEEEEEKLGNLTEFKKLLYERGEVLERIVWKTFDEIGIDVSEYDNQNEDGSIEIDSQTYVLEIKGVSRAAKTKHVRQINDHINRYLEKNGREPGGLLIVNHYRNESPENRNDAFVGDLKQAVQSSSRDIKLLTTYELFRIYRQVKLGEIDTEEAKKKILKQEN